MQIPKQYTPFIITALIFIVLAIAACLYGLSGRTDFLWSNKNIQKPPAAVDFQKYIDDIMTDPQIDISDWPTFTNTKYGWSIKYHPEGVWQSNDPQSLPEGSSNPSYLVPGGECGYFSASVIENMERLDTIDLIRGYFVDISKYIILPAKDGFWLISKDSYYHFLMSKNKEFVVWLKISHCKSQYLEEQLIKSVLVFNL